MKKRLRPLLLAIFLLSLIVPPALAAEYWASQKSNKYHYPSCSSAKKIKPENLIKFQSPEEAQKAGYVPCKICRPAESIETDAGEAKKGMIKASVPNTPERAATAKKPAGRYGAIRQEVLSVAVIRGESFWQL